MSNADDNTVIALVKSTVTGAADVWDGHVEDSDPDAKVVRASLPYLVFYGTTDDASPGDSLGGGSGAHLTEFQLTGVGETREQAMLALEMARGALDRKFVTFASGPRFVRRTNDNQYVRRDDTWTRPGGDPLFFGVDRYAVLI